MRITGGLARSIVLDVPQNMGVRPATDFTREQIFNRIASKIVGAQVLDCCAGTGAYGLEALSREAKHITFIEKNIRVARLIQCNCDKICKSIQKEPQLCTKIFTADVFRFDFSILNVKFDYIFFDPPYFFWEEYKNSIYELLKKWAKEYPATTLVIEYPSQFVWPTLIPWGPIYPTKTSSKVNSPTINLFVHKNRSESA